MKKNYKVLSILIFLASFSTVTHATESVLITSDNFSLKTDYFKPNIASDRAVLMLHQCNYNRSMYTKIGEQLAQLGIHALSLDFRGFGESVNHQYDIEKVRSQPDDTRRSAWLTLSQNWPDDVALAYNYLKSKTGNHGRIAIIGASCGGTQAVNLAQSTPMSAIVFFSSAQNETNIARYKTDLANVPTLIIAAEQDGRTYSSAKTLFDSAMHINSKLISYKGPEHGY
ncbi:dienelactone hydrolase family protein, partial [Pseudoalteromonas sp. MMG012]|uniref:dienelactone hydrolase family protein n=1 Tax=Pseudoalteromonas sp. MMG012 TaxID=2822686 RepID=UPI001B3A7058